VLHLLCAAAKQLKKRSEVDRRLEQLVLRQSWKLKEPSKQSVIKVKDAPMFVTLTASCSSFSAWLNRI